MVDSYYLGYELSWEDSLFDVVDNFIQIVFQHAVLCMGTILNLAWIVSILKAYDENVVEGEGEHRAIHHNALFQVV